MFALHCSFFVKTFAISRLMIRIIYFSCFFLNCFFFVQTARYPRVISGCDSLPFRALPGVANLLLSGGDNSALSSPGK